MRDEIMKRSEYETNLRSAYAVIAGQRQMLEDADTKVRSARRQLDLFLRDGERARVTAALANLDAIPEPDTGPDL